MGKLFLLPVKPMGFTSESAKRALKVKAGMASWRARVSKLGIEHFQAEAARMRQIKLDRIAAAGLSSASNTKPNGAEDEGLDLITG